MPNKKRGRGRGRPPKNKKLPVPVELPDPDTQEEMVPIPPEQIAPLIVKVKKEKKFSIPKSESAPTGIAIPKYRTRSSTKVEETALAKKEIETPKSPEPESEPQIQVPRTTATPSRTYASKYYLPFTPTFPITANKVQRIGPSGTRKRSGNGTSTSVVPAKKQTPSVGTSKCVPATPIPEAPKRKDAIECLDTCLASVNHFFYHELLDQSTRNHAAQSLGLSPEDPNFKYPIIPTRLIGGALKPPEKMTNLLSAFEELLTVHDEDGPPAQNDDDRDFRMVD